MRRWRKRKWWWWWPTRKGPRRRRRRWPTTSVMLLVLVDVVVCRASALAPPPDDRCLRPRSVSCFLFLSFFPLLLVSRRHRQRNRSLCSISPILYLVYRFHSSTLTFASFHTELRVRSIGAAHCHPGDTGHTVVHRFVATFDEYSRESAGRAANILERDAHQLHFERWPATLVGIIERQQGRRCQSAGRLVAVRHDRAQ